MAMNAVIREQLEDAAKNELETALITKDGRYTMPGLLVQAVEEETLTAIDSHKALLTITTDMIGGCVIEQRQPTWAQ